MATSIPVPAGQVVGVDYLNEVVRAHWRKLTAKAVTNTVAETDLLNGEVTVEAGSIGVDRGLRLTAWGDWVDTVANNISLPRFKVKLGATPTVVLDTGATPTGGGTVGIQSTATRGSWKLVFELLNLGVANSQMVNLDGRVYFPKSSGLSGVNFATGEGRYEINGVDPGLASMQGFNTCAIDTAVDMALILSVINPTATATCETKLYGATLEAI